MRVFGTGEACLVYQSGQEIGLVQEGLVGVPKWPGDRIGTGGACLVYQSGQEIGLVQLFPKRRGRLRK